MFLAPLAATSHAPAAGMTLGTASVPAAASSVGAGTSRQHLEHGPSCEVSPAWTQTAQPSTGPTAAAFHGRPAAFRRRRTAAAPSTPRESSGGASLGLPAPAPAARGARLPVGGAPVFHCSLPGAPLAGFHFLRSPGRPYHYGRLGSLRKRQQLPVPRAPPPAPRARPPAPRSLPPAPAPEPRDNALREAPRGLPSPFRATLSLHLRSEPGLKLGVGHDGAG